MTLKELKKMIAEEFTAYQNEADDVDVSVSDADVDVDAEMGGEEAAGEEDVLRSIFDLLKTHFEGGAEDMGDDVPDLDDEEDVSEMGDMSEMGSMDEEEMDEEEMMEEGDGYDGKTTGSTKDSGYVKPGGKGGTGYDAGSKALQERFQKLANIIK